MPTPPKKKKDFTEDRLGQPFMVEAGERFQPIRSRYRLTDWAAFEGVVHALFADGNVRRGLLEAVRGRRLDQTERMALLVQALLTARPRLTLDDAVLYLDEQVPKLLARTDEVALTLNGKTARDKSRAARKQTVRSLKAYRR